MKFHLSADQSEKLLSRLGRQAPFVVAYALTLSAKDGREKLKAELPSIFDRPTPWTMNSTRVEPARKKDREPTSAVYFREFAHKGTPAAKYLGPQVYAGERRDKRSERALKYANILPPHMQTVPGQAADLDAYGNMKRGQITKILSHVRASTDSAQNRSRTRKSRGRRRKEQYFAATPGSPRTAHLHPGIYKRRDFAMGSAIKPVLMFVDKPNYDARLDMEGIIRAEVGRVLEANVRKAMNRALRTAR